MLKVLAVMGLLSMFGFSSSTDDNAGKVCVLKVEGMACGACAARVEKEARKIDGVKAAKVNQPKAVAEITYDPAKTSPAAIAKRISENTPFKAQAPKS